MCLLSCITFHSPLSDADVVAIREAERKLETERGNLGLPRYLAEGAKFRVPGPLWPFFDANGHEIPMTSNLHPFGPNRRKYRAVDSDDDDEEGVCLASRYCQCTIECVLCNGTGIY